MKWRVVLSENYKMGSTHDVIVKGETRDEALREFRKMQQERFISGDIIEIVPVEQSNPPREWHLKYLRSQLPGADPRYLGAGHYATAYHIGGEVYLFVENDFMKSAIEEQADMTLPHLPKIERLDDPSPNRDTMLFKMPYYAPLTAARKQAWADYKALRDAREKARSIVMTRSEKAREPVSQFVLRGHEINDLIAEDPSLREPIRIAIRELSDAAANYGSSVTFEFSPRNLGVDREGCLILRDVLFDAESIHREFASKARQNPYSSRAEYWHFRIEDKAKFTPGTLRTVSSKKHDKRVEYVMGRLKGHTNMTVQKVLILKSAMPDPREAGRYVKSLLRDPQGWENCAEVRRPPNVRGESSSPRDRQGWENPGAELMVFGINPPVKGNPLGINPEDSEMPLIYGKTYRIEMRKTRGSYKGQRFYHNFGEGVAQYGLPEGATVVTPQGKQVKLPRRTVLLVGPRGLWGHYS